MDVFEDLGITFLVISALPSRSTQQIVELLGPRDEVIFAPIYHGGVGSQSHAALLERASNPTVFVLHAYEEISSTLIDQIRQAARSMPSTNFQITCDLPRASGSTGYTRPEVRLIQSCASGVPTVLLEGVQIRSHLMHPTDAKHALQHRLVSALEWVEEQPEAPTPWTEAAGVFLASGQFGHAEATGRHAMLRSVGDERLDAGQIVAAALMHNRKHAQLLEHVRTELSLGHETRTLHYIVARSYLQARQFNQALYHIDECLGLPDGPILTFETDWAFSAPEILKAEILVRMTRLGEAMAIMEQLDDEALATPRAGLVMAMGLSNLGHWAEALHAVQPAIPYRQTHAEATHLAAQALRQVGQLEASADAYRRAWEAGITDSATFSEWVRVCEVLGDSERLNEAYRVFGETGDANSPMLLAWGRDFDAAGDTEKARNCFAEALRRAPLDPAPYFALGDLLMRTEAYLDAAHVFESGLRLDPDRTDIITLRAACLSRAGISAGAERAAA